MRFFFKLSFLLLLLQFFVNSSNGQQWLGFHSSNYTPLNRIQFQPASIADSRFGFYFNWISVDAGISNNYWGVDRNNFDDVEYETLHRGLKGDKAFLFAKANLLGPSFMVTMSPKHAFAFTSRVRSVINLSGFSKEGIEFLDSLADDKVIVDANRRFDFSDFQIGGHTWAEWGLTYARVIFDDQDKFLKAGVTVKLLNGIGSGFAYVNKLRYSGIDGENVDVGEINIDYGYPSYFDDDDFEDNIEKGLINRVWGKPSVGFDLGVVYEHRPDYNEFLYDMDGKTSLVRRDRNKYRYRIGFSILDIGAVKYKQSKKTGNFQGSTEGLDPEDLDGDIDEVVDSLFNFTPGSEYKMSLPTALAAEFDYRVTNKFYLNFTPYIALKHGKSDKDKVHYFSTFSVTPRLEGKGLGLGVPLSYNRVSRFSAGLNVRLGPLMVGSSDLLSYLLTNDPVYHANVQFGLRFGIPFKKKKDKDKDGVSNKYDNCRKVPGVWEFKGCPDRDGDGVQDSEDKCPDTPGVKAFQGCPDTDGDGIEDKNDQCLELAGLSEFNGCPDTDGDGVVDGEDVCPEVAGVTELAGCPDRDKDGVADENDTCPDTAGLVEFNGCPDTDGDGIADIDDLCPELYGPKEESGCPDTDGDGVHNHKDKCPNEAGLIENSGCPFADTDGDGIRDLDDKCPNVAGVIENDGCPAIEKEEQEVINTAFENLEFESGKSKITTSSYTSLVELANLLKKKPDWNLLIEGHTDNVGSRANNLKLSKARGQAVADFLTAQGIAATRLKVEGHGPDKPIAPVDTKEGRKKNRRVELTIIFE